MPAGAAAYCRESLVRLKPGLQINDVRIKISTFIRRFHATGCGRHYPGLLPDIRCQAGASPNPQSPIANRQSQVTQSATANPKSPIANE
jgi:hypothetical protein